MVSSHSVHDLDYTQRPARSAVLGHTHPSHSNPMPPLFLRGRASPGQEELTQGRAPTPRLNVQSLPPTARGLQLPVPAQTASSCGKKDRPGLGVPSAQPETSSEEQLMPSWTAAPTTAASTRASEMVCEKAIRSRFLHLNPTAWFQSDHGKDRNGTCLGSP